VPVGTGAAFVGDFPDPSVLVVGDRYVAYSTQSGGENIQVISSTDLLHWSRPRDALPVLPGWAEAGYTWAPAVVADPSGGYEMYFAARDAALGLQCIGRATSPSPLGPFADPSPRPFLCQASLGGSIDPYVFASGGTSYLIWKSDGENGSPQQVWSAVLDATNTGLAGPAVLLLSATSDWEDGVVEGPAMLQTPTGLFLYFSGNRWSTSAYSIGAVGCDTPLGPCVNAPTGQVVSSLSDLSGPGGPTFFVATDGEPMMAFAAWSGPPGSTTGRRELYVDAVDTTGTSPTLTEVLVPRRTPATSDR
jgi:beta-xylosidase